MSVDRSNKITLEYIKKLEKEENSYRIEEEQVKSWKQKIERYIQNLSDENADELIKLFDKNSAIQKFWRTEEIKYISIWVIIFSEERKNNITNTIFTGRKTIKEVMSVWRKAYFLLWRIEFGIGVDAKDQFLIFLEKEKISLMALQYLLLTKSAYLEKTSLLLIQEFLEIGKYGYAKTILLFLKFHGAANDEVDRLLQKLL